MKKILFFIYNLILYIYSFVVNIFLLIKLKRILGEKEFLIRLKGMKKFFLFLKSTTDIDLLFRVFKYIKDPILSIKLGLTINYIPFYKTFFLEKGGDCSVFARMAYRMLKELNLNPKLWLITEKGSLLNMIRNSHIICVYEENNLTWIYNVKEKEMMKGCNIEEHMQEDIYENNLGVKFKYKNIFKMRWF